MNVISKYQRYKLRENQSGVASLIITLVFMVVISLVVLGFSQISRREQTQSLNRQLSTQAYYAAETGINDAVHVITTSGWLSTHPTGKTSCQPPTWPNPPDPFFNGLNIIDSTNNIQYSCLLINPTPGTLTFQLDPSDPTKQAKVENLSAINAGSIVPVKSLTFGWSNPGNGTLFTSCPTIGFTSTFPSTWPINCAAGVLRVDIIQDSSTNNRGNILNNTQTMFFVPQPFASGNTSYNVGSTQGAVVPASCFAGSCQVTINGLSQPSYDARIQAIYENATVAITGVQLGTSNPVGFQGSQIMIDSTGKSQGVLRRIVEWVPYSSQTIQPNYGVESGLALCKRFTVQYTVPTSKPVNDAAVPATCPNLD